MLLSEHKVAERLTAALNDALATLAPQPFKHMVRAPRARRRRRAAALGGARGPGASTLTRRACSSAG